MDAIGRICPMTSYLSGFQRKFVRWCRIGMWDFPWDFLDGNSVRVHMGVPTCSIRLEATCPVGAKFV